MSRARVGDGERDTTTKASPPSEASATSTPANANPAYALALRRKIQQRRAQRKAETAAAQNDPASVHAAAERGTRGSGGALPHLETIQKSFGRHDVSGVKAHTGAEASEAATAMGAEAFATGNDVAFGGTPSLHTAAHEAAHVVQQRSGVHLKGGVGEDGDPYERHADQVADAVVAGKSAEGLLDQSLGSTPGVQRKSDEKQPTTPQIRRRLEIYLQGNELPVLRALGAYMAEITLPNPHARLVWDDMHSFKEKLLRQLESNLHGMPLLDLETFVYPRNIQQAVANFIPETDAWSQPFGLALCQSLHSSIVESLHRLSTSFLDAYDRASGNATVEWHELILSAPIDRYVGVAMTNARPVPLRATPPTADQTKAAKAKPTGLRKVKVTYQGGVDPSLWNWVRADPPDATPEEVAAELWAVSGTHGETNASYNAFLLTNAAPLFGVPKDIAARDERAKGHIPRDVASKDDSKEAELVTLGASKVADDVALTQQKTADDRAGAQVAANANTKAGVLLAQAVPTPDARALHEALNDCSLQLEFTAGDLASWNLAGRVMPARTFIAGKAGALAAAKPEDVAKWQPVIMGQRERLTRITSGINATTTAAKKFGITDPTAPEADLLNQVLGLYASAAGCSHLSETSEAKLVEAQTKQASLQLLALQANQRNLVGSRESMEAAYGGTKMASQAATDASESEQLRTRSLALQQTMINGGKVDDDELDDVTLRSQEISLKERLLTTITMSGSLLTAAVAAGDGVMAHVASIGQGKFKGLKPTLDYIRTHCADLFNELMVQERQVVADQQNKALTPADKKRSRAERRVKLNDVQDKFNKLSEDKDLAHYFKEASESVKDQQFRTACWQMAALIGIAIAAAFTAGVAAEALGGALMTAQGVTTVAELSGVARAGIMVANFATDTVVNSAGQSFVQGTSFKEALLQNAIMGVASMALFGTIAKLESAAMRSEARLGAAVGMAEKSAAKFSELGTVGKAMFVGKEALTISAHTVWGMAIGYAAGKIDERLFHKGDGQQVAQKPTDMEAREWLMQGAAVAIGRGIHSALGERMPGLERLAKKTGRAQQVLLEARRLSLLAENVEKTKNAGSASALLDERLKFLEEEAAAIEEIAAREGDPKGEYKKQHEEIQGQIKESRDQAMLDTHMRLHGLQELVPGALWKGTRDQVRDAIDDARARGGTAKTNEHGRTTIEVDGRKLEIQQVEDSRERVSAGQLKELGEHLGVPVTIDANLRNGVSIDAEPVKGILGTDLHPKSVRVGPDALVADIRAHAGSIERITKYNGVVGKIRSLWSRFSARGGHNPYKPGSVGFHAFEEVRKINEIIELRRSAWNLHDLDPRILGEEIEFLEGRRSFFEEVLRSGEETGTLSESASKEFSSPDTGIVTSMALSHGYELPDGRQGAARDWYYYRHNADRPTEFELVRKPEAPAEAPALRAKVVDGKFAGFEMGETPKESKSYDQSWSPKRVATDMLTEGALVPYVAMLEKMKIKAGSRESVMKRIEQLVEERQTKNPKQPYKADQLRGKVKEDFKDEVTTHLKGASYERMQELINPLDNGDRGHLAEQWYRLNYAPDAKSQVQVGKVATDKGTPRTIDLLDGKVMIEIKDVQGSIDHDQFEAYLGLLTTGEFGPKEGPTKVSALKYVFIDPAGALANLGWIRDNAKGVRGITIEFFDYNGEKQTTTPSKIDKAIEMLQGQRAKIAKKPQ